MKNKTTYTLLLSFLLLSANSLAKGAEAGDCSLAERYYRLAQASIADYDEAAAAGWFDRASSECPRFEYFFELGELRMSSPLSDERIAAIAAFTRAHEIAESDQQKSQALFQSASVLFSLGELDSASFIVSEAQRIDASNQEIVSLAEEIEAALADLESTADGSTSATNRSSSVGLFAKYPWPPEEASWRIQIDRDIDPPFESGTSFGDVEARLTDALRGADYAASVYSAPGGFVIVTRLEAVDTDGTPLPDNDRFRLPNENRAFDFGSYVRGLFYAPEGFYRYIAFVVTDDLLFQTSENQLAQEEALDRLKYGAVGLPSEYARREFTEDHRIIALIYEFRKGADENSIETILPGRISYNLHMVNSGLADSLFGESAR